MARQRRDQQHARLLGVDVLLEMQQRAERRDMRGLLAHLDLAVADGDVGDAERRAVVGQARARDQLIGGGQIAHDAVAGHPDAGVAERAGRHARERSDRAHHVGMGLIGRVQHSKSPAVSQPPGTAEPLPRSAKRLVHLLLHCEIISSGRVRRTAPAGEKHGQGHAGDRQQELRLVVAPRLAALQNGGARIRRGHGIERRSIDPRGTAAAVAVVPGALPDPRRRQDLGHARDRRISQRAQPGGRSVPEGRAARAPVAARSPARCIPASATCARRCR